MTRREFLILSGLAGAGAVLGGPPPAFAVGERLAVGVVGLGRRGLYHVDALLRIPGVEIAALCDPDPNALGTALGVLEQAGRNRPRLAGDWRDLAGMAGLDAVAVATHAAARHEIAEEACRSGLHVMTELPSREPGWLAALAQTAASHGRLVQWASPAYRPNWVDGELPAGLPGLLALRSASVWRTHQARPQVGEGGEVPSAFSRAFDEFDYAQGVLGVGIPSSVTAVEMREQATGRVLRAQARFVFPGDDTERVIVVQVHSVPVSTNGPTRAGVQFAGSGAAVSVRYGPQTDGWAILPVWENFLSCIRSAEPSGLCSPLAAAQRTASLLGLAAAAVAAKRPFTETDLGSAANPEVRAFVSYLAPIPA